MAAKRPLSRATHIFTSPIKLQAVGEELQALISFLFRGAIHLLRLAMDVQFYLFLIALWLFAYVILFLRSANGCSRNQQPLPPSPMPLPLLGHLYLLRPLMHRSFDALANRYGPIILLRLGTLGNTFLVSSPALAREFLKYHDLAFASRPWLVAQNYVGGHESLSFTFLPYGPRWKFFKKVLVTHVLSARRLEKAAGIRQEEIKLFLGSLLDNSRAGEIAHLEEMLSVLTNRVICRMMLGVKGNIGTTNEAEEYRQLVEEQVNLSSKSFIVHLLLGNIINFDLFGYGKRLKKANERFMELVDKMIEEHEQKKKKLQERGTKQAKEDGDEEEEEEDMLDFLLKSAEDEEAECKITRHNIRTFLLVCFLINSSFMLFHPWTLLSNAHI